MKDKKLPPHSLLFTLRPPVASPSKQTGAEILAFHKVSEQPGWIEILEARFDDRPLPLPMLQRAALGRTQFPDGDVLS